jgi:hypothetical protein
MLRPYVHLQTVNLNKNQLNDISEMMHLTYLVSLSASGNEIKSMKFFEEFSMTMQYLQVSATSNFPGGRFKPEQTYAVVRHSSTEIVQSKLFGERNYIVQTLHRPR